MNVFGTEELCKLYFDHTTTSSQCNISTIDTTNSCFYSTTTTDSSKSCSRTHSSSTAVLSTVELLVQTAVLCLYCAIHLGQQPIAFLCP